MANALNAELEGQNVVLSAEYYDGSEQARTFHCESGNGCHSFTMGRGIFGHFVDTGEKCRVEGYEVEKLAS